MPKLLPEAFQAIRKPCFSREKQGFAEVPPRGVAERISKLFADNDLRLRSP